MEYLTEFSDCQSHSVRILQDGTNLFLASGHRDVLVFNVEERRVTASAYLLSNCVLYYTRLHRAHSLHVVFQTEMQFEASVTNFALSDDKYRLYALCDNGGLYCTPLPQLR